MYARKQIFAGLEKESAFLWGVRQSGKSTLLKELFPDSLYFDLLKADEYNRFISNPSILRETVSIATVKQPVIIDEIQLIPALLNEIHWSIYESEYSIYSLRFKPKKNLAPGSKFAWRQGFKI